MRSATRKREGKDRGYLAWIHTIPCVAVSDYSPCGGRVHAHHAGEHGMSQKAPDRTAIPLCASHHQTGPHAVHRLGREFWSFHRLDMAGVVEALNSLYERLREAA